MPPTPDTLTIEQFGRRWRAGDVSAVEVTEACLRAIEAHNAALNAFITVMGDDARRQAADADRERAAGRDRGPLHGVPIAIKDLIDIKGVPTTAASRVRDGHVASSDAPVITQLRRAGAVLIGKTNLHEFAYGTTSEDSAFGAVRNPHDRLRTPGGSSGGSAAAIVAGMTVAALGSDTGGSIRIPAAACGTVGLKATYGEVSADGVIPLARSFDHVGPLARTVADAWLVHRALTGADGAAAPAAPPLAGMKIAIPRTYFCEVMDADVRARFDESVAALQRAGARIAPVEIPHASLTSAVYLHIHASEGSEYHARMLETMADRYTPTVRLRLEMGRYILAEDYVRAQNARLVLVREVDAAIGDCAALMLPTMPIPAPPIGADTVTIDGRDEQVRALMLRCTQLFNVTGHPAIAMPCGVTPEGLPCSLQLVGRRSQTDALCRIALAVEDAIGGLSA
jgi:aspartyl-tRNA(Asn)/glutamyl-tRNA(Gln) amidotransferase subunit A